MDETETHKFMAAHFNKPFLFFFLVNVPSGTHVLQIG